MCVTHVRSRARVTFASLKRVREVLFKRKVKQLQELVKETAAAQRQLKEQSKEAIQFAADCFNEIAAKWFNAEAARASQSKQISDLKGAVARQRHSISLVWRFVRRSKKVECANRKSAVCPEPRTTPNQ